MPNFKLLNTIRALKPATKQDEDLHRAIQKEFENIQGHMNVGTPTTITETTVVVGGNTSPSSPIPVSSSNDRASFVAITSAVDQFIPFSSAIGVGYVLTVWFLDNTGSAGTIGVLQSDWLANGFWLRANLIPISDPAVSGVLFYIAKAIG